MFFSNFFYSLVMFSFPKKTTDVEDELSMAELLIFKQIPGYTNEADRERDLIVAVIKAYGLSKRVKGDVSSLMTRIFFCARCAIRICSDDASADYQERVLKRTGLNSGMIGRIKKIAQEGRLLEKNMKTISFEQRRLSGRIFIINRNMFAVALPQKRRGCSTSVCGNCHEPVAFADGSCPNCRLQFIGPFGMPEFDEWKIMSSRSRSKLTQKIYRLPKNGRL